MITEKFSDSKPVLVYAAAALTGPGDNFGASIDTQYYNSLTAAIAITITTGEVASITWQESSDNNVSDAWEDIPAQENMYYPDDFPLTGASSFLVHAGCIAKERYVRVKIVTTGTVSIALDGAYGLLQDSLTKPMVKESSVIADADVISPDATADAVTTPPKREA
jgi:hypothetical protein